MKRIYFLIPSLLLLTIFKVSAQDYILLPENFFLHKGDTLKVHLVTANQFLKPDELKYEPAQTAKFVAYAGSKRADLTSVAKDGASPIISFQAENEGLTEFEMVRRTVTDDVDRDDFLKILDDEGMTKEAEKARNSSKDSFTEKYTWYLKSLVEVDKKSSKILGKPLNDDLEIILKDNPYKGSYGDDIIAQVNFNGKPLVNANVILYVKVSTGNVFAQKLSSDKSGFVYFKLSREGIYLLRTLHIEPSKEKSADFESWLASYTFAFSSSDDVPNSYKSFGFGDKH
jgi:uncharacterized protein DUF4198